MVGADKAKPEVQHRCGVQRVIVVKLIRVGENFPVAGRTDGRRQGVVSRVCVVQIVRPINTNLRLLANILVEFDTGDVPLLHRGGNLVPVVH